MPSLGGVESAKDHFAVMRQPRRPWLDSDHLKQEFLARSADVHPDRADARNQASQAAAQENFTTLNTAYNCLRNPRTRLQHFLELETGSRPEQVQNVPAQLTDIFFAVGAACREADALLRKKLEAVSPLLQVEMFEIAQNCIEKLMALQKQLATRTETLLQRVQELDAIWINTRESASRSKVLEELNQIHHLLGYFERWKQQLQERIVPLNF